MNPYRESAKLRFFVLMTTYPWDSLMTADGVTVSMQPGPGKPCRYMPVFDTYEDAVEFRGVGTGEIMAVSTGAPEPNSEDKT